MSAERLSALDAIYKSFDISDSKLQELSKLLLNDFENGLRGDPKALAMVPSYVTRIPNGSETGSFLTLDFEWTAFRVSQIQLEGRRQFTSINKVFNLPSELKVGELSAFVDFVVESIITFLNENGISGSRNEPLPLGVTFPFALNKTAIGKSTIAGWSKGFSLTSGVGEDILELLQSGLANQGAYVKGVAIINDTVATTLAEAYLSNGCAIGTIFGIGTNAAILEKSSNVKTLRQAPGEQILVNTEWGAFGSGKKILPTTPYDNKLQRESVRPGRQAYEKLVGWMYLGEIVRNVVTSLIDHAVLFNGASTPILNAPFGLDTYLLAQIEKAESLEEIKALLVENLQFQPGTISDSDAEVVRKLAQQVATRAARLSAIGVAAAITRGGYANERKITVGVSGELILLYPGFEERLRQGLAAIIGSATEKKVEFKVIGDPSALGAALAVYETQNARI